MFEEKEREKSQKYIYNYTFTETCCISCVFRRSFYIIYLQMLDQNQHILYIWQMVNGITF